ncbi:hypothetical protein HDV02_006224, partial [Globomyces sp. JEL0801]
DEMKPKSKEMKMMVKMAMTGGRKKLNSTTPKKKMLDAAKAALQAKKLAAKKEKMRLKELKKVCVCIVNGVDEERVGRFTNGCRLILNFGF